MSGEREQPCSHMKVGIKDHLLFLDLGIYNNPSLKKFGNYS